MARSQENGIGVPAAIRQFLKSAVQVMWLGCRQGSQASARGVLGGGPYGTEPVLAARDKDRAEWGTMMHERGSKHPFANGVEATADGGIVTDINGFRLLADQAPLRASWFLHSLKPVK